MVHRPQCLHHTCREARSEQPPQRALLARVKVPSPLLCIHQPSVERIFDEERSVRSSGVGKVRPIFVSVVIMVIGQNYEKLSCRGAEVVLLATNRSQTKEGYASL